jgi:ribosomal protein S18 acetylase RimI-like enzyme
MNESEIIYRVNPKVTNDELNALYAASWRNHSAMNFQPVLRQNLAYVCARHSERLIGFIRLAWDGDIHAFVLEPTVHPDFRRRGIGTQLVKQAAIAAKERGVEWLHVDFEPHLQEFYDKCGFRDTRAGLMNLKDKSDI